MLDKYSLSPLPDTFVNLFLIFRYDCRFELSTLSDFDSDSWNINYKVRSECFPDHASSSKFFISYLKRKKGWNQILIMNVIWI